MDNFHHEIPCPEDRAIRKFLWVSYFHDSPIECIRYDQPEHGSITLQVESAPDSSELYQRCPGSSREERIAYLEQHWKPRYTYLLRFHRVKYMQYTSAYAFSCEDILATRFLDTPLLRRKQAETGKPLYHLRIHTTHGAMDIIFERFSVRRQEGRVDYRCDVDCERNYWEDVVRIDAAATRKRLSGLPENELDEDDRADLMMCRLFECEQSGDVASMLPLARRAVSKMPESLWPADTYAARLLGFHGDQSDLPALMKRYFDPDIDGYAQHATRDAIERILERTSKEV